MLHVPQIIFAYMQVMGAIYSFFEVSVKYSLKYTMRYLLLKKIPFIWSLSFF